MGGRGSGRQPEKPLTKDAIKKLFDGLNLATAEDNRQLLQRADELMLAGKMQVRHHINLVKSVNARRSLIIDAEVDRRVAKVVKAAQDIKRARTGGRKLRDVGPPDDDLNKPT